MLFFVKYALINFRSSNQFTISIDLISIRISIRIISIRISKQSKHRDQQAKGYRESALSCIKKYALCCMWNTAYLIEMICFLLYMIVSSFITQFYKPLHTASNEPKMNFQYNGNCTYLL